MPYLSLYRKYRPQTFDEILGQEHVARTLARAIEEDRVSHAYLFTGPRGTGKTSTARILAKALNCVRGPTPTPCGECESCVAIANGSSLDVIEMDAASHSKVEETRDILAGVALATAGGRKKVYVIDEVHMLTTGSFNALLKTLEEPPPHVVFILATTEAHKVLGTIVSRTQRFDFRRVPAEVLEGLLEHIAKLEGIDVEPAALAAIARHAEGGARDAVSALDQLSSLGGRVTEEDAERVLGERSEEVYVELFDALAAGDVSAVFSGVGSLVAQGEDVRQLAVGMLAHARSLLLLKTSPDASGLLDVSDQDLALMTAQVQHFSAETLVRALDLIAKALTEMRNTPNHRLLLEIALVRIAAPDTDPSAGGLLGRIERLERRIGIEVDGEAAAQERVPMSAVSQAREESAAPSRPAPVPQRTAAKPNGTPGEGARGPSSGLKERAPTSPSQGAVPSAASEAPDTPPEAVEGAAAESSPPPAHIGFSHVRDAWPATLKEVNRRSKRVWGLLSPSRPLRLEDDVLVVEVQSPFHEASMSEARHSGMVADALHAALGVRPALQFTARGAEPAQQAEAAGEVVAELADSTEVAPSAEHDPVELVKRGFAAEVVEER